MCILDDDLWINFSVEFIDKSLWSPNLKTCFSFSLLNARRTCFKPGLFGVAGLKLGWICQNELEKASFRCILEQKKTCFMVGRPR